MGTHPIGIIDSGSGGLSIWKSIVSLMPHESILYLGDHLHIPYSDKSQTYIRSRVVLLIQTLMKHHCKLCVIACNTATVAGIDYFRKRFPNLPIVGVVPVIKTAATLTKTNTFCVLSTRFTSRSPYQKKLIEMFAPDKHVISIGSSTLVSLIETYPYQKKKIQEELQSILFPLQHYPIDVVVLGCTHYPFIKQEIASCMGKHVAIIDSGEAVARQVNRILVNNKQVNHSKVPTYVFFTTGDAHHVSSIVSSLLKQHIVVEHVPIS